jgi:ABC-type uncharacterized transport system substrate-binding protein
MIRSRRVWTGVFLIIFFSFLVWFNLTKPRIMVVQSYTLDFPWSRDLDKGISRILDGKPILLRKYYLDTKRNPDEEYKIRAGAAGRREILKWKPDVIIAVDDNAQDMVAKHFINDPNTSIIFTGLNATPQKYGYDKAENVTGVIERIPFKAVHESFMLINPKGRFVHICDSSETSEYIQHELEEFDWSPLTLVETVRCPTYKEWVESIKVANEKADFLLITHYHTIKDETGRVMRPPEVLEATKKLATVPMVGCWDFFVEDGGMLSVSVSPFEQGEVAAKMAQQIVEFGKKAKDLPIYRNTQFTISMRGNQIKQFKIQIPIIFEAFARGLNHYYD